MVEVLNQLQSPNGGGGGGGGGGCGGGGGAGLQQRMAAAAAAAGQRQQQRHPGVLPSYLGYQNHSGTKEGKTKSVGLYSIPCTGFYAHSS